MAVSAPGTGSKWSTAWGDDWANQSSSVNSKAVAPPSMVSRPESTPASST